MKSNTLNTAFFFGAPMAISVIIFNSIIQGGFTMTILVSGALGGIVGGLAFSFALHYFANRLFKTIHVDIPGTERLIKEGKANHLTRGEGVGGKLALTDRRLIFKSHKFNIQNGQQSFEVSHIRKVQTGKTLKIFQNRLNLDLADGMTLRFIVDEPNEWAKMIDYQRTGADHVF